MPEQAPPLVLRIHGGDEPIAGELCPPNAPARRFTGWMELVALIEQWRAKQIAEPKGRP